MIQKEESVEDLKNYVAKCNDCGALGGMTNVIKKSEASEYAKLNLAKIMKESAVGVRELARMSENSAMTVSRILNHGTLPSVDCLLRIAKALDISIDELFQKPRKVRSRKKLEKTA